MGQQRNARFHAGLEDMRDTVKLADSGSGRATRQPEIHWGQDQMNVTFWLKISKIHLLIESDPF